METLLGLKRHMQKQNAIEIENRNLQKCTMPVLTYATQT